MAHDPNCRRCHGRGSYTETWPVRHTAYCHCVAPPPAPPPLTDEERERYAPADIITQDAAGNPLPAEVVRDLQEMRTEINRDLMVGGVRNGSTLKEALVALILNRCANQQQPAVPAGKE